MTPAVLSSTPATFRFVIEKSHLLSVWSAFVRVLFPAPGSPTTNVLTAGFAGFLGHFDGRCFFHCLLLRVAPCRSKSRMIWEELAKSSAVQPSLVLRFGSTFLFRSWETDLANPYLQVMQEDVSFTKQLKTLKLALFCSRKQEHWFSCLQNLTIPNKVICSYKCRLIYRKAEHKLNSNVVWRGFTNWVKHKLVAGCAAGHDLVPKMNENNHPNLVHKTEQTLIIQWWF